MSEYMDESYNSADTVISKLLKSADVDYTSGREEIARIFDEYLYNGEYDMTTEFDGELGLKDLRLIQEDEYDQSMDEDEKPDWDDQICFASGHYVFWA